MTLGFIFLLSLEGHKTVAWEVLSVQSLSLQDQEHLEVSWPGYKHLSQIVLPKTTRACFFLVSLVPYTLQLGILCWEDSHNLQFFVKVTFLLTEDPF